MAAATHETPTSADQTYGEKLLRTHLQKRRWWVTILYVLGWLGAGALLVVSWGGADMRIWELWTNRANVAEISGDFFPPKWLYWRETMLQMWVTIQIAIWGTLLAVVFSIPCGLMCARNVAPFWLRQPMRRLMDVFRAVNEIVWALLFIAAVGLGPFPGVLALFIHTLGTLAKLFSEAVEAIDPRPVEGIRATGGGPLDEINYGVIPQVMPLWVSYTLYRFESNVRSATVIGIVGAGGIGLLLWDTMRNFQYQHATAMFVVITVVVVVIDRASEYLRKLFI